MTTATLTKPKLNLNLPIVINSEQCPKCIGGQLFPDDDEQDTMYCLQCGHRVPIIQSYKEDGL